MVTCHRYSGESTLQQKQVDPAASTNFVLCRTREDKGWMEYEKPPLR